jgi:hypothetical protein
LYGTGKKFRGRKNAGPKKSWRRMIVSWRSKYNVITVATKGELM